METQRQWSDPAVFRTTAGVIGVQTCPPDLWQHAAQHFGWWVEMLVVETIDRIRRAHLVQGKTIKAISRELGTARNTIRRILRLGETSFAYQRDVQPRPKLGQ